MFGRLVSALVHAHAEVHVADDFRAVIFPEIVLCDFVFKLFFAYVLVFHYPAFLFLINCPDGNRKNILVHNIAHKIMKIIYAGKFISLVFSRPTTFSMNL
jgi:hypothetical protein